MFIFIIAKKKSLKEVFLLAFSLFSFLFFTKTQCLL